MKHNICVDRIKAGVHIPWTMASDAFELLRFRRKEIATEVSDLSERLRALTAEDEELASAERVLERFGAVPPGAPTSTTESTGKPPYTPTTPNMILQLLREAQNQGKAGLEPREMQIQIAKRWWPAVKSEDVGPTAWRMWKDGRLYKEDSVYSLAKNKEATDDLLRSSMASE
jgi:hypothetical protein